jgi:hypothetical protein
MTIGLKLYRNEVEDEYSRQNFQRLQDFLNSFPLAKGDFKFFEITVTSAVTNYKFKHNLGFVPLDVLQTYVSGGATVSWSYDSFDRSNVVFTTSGPTTIRAFIGRYA